MKQFLTILMCVLAMSEAVAGITLEECIAKAEENYPLIRKYDLLTTTAEIDLSDINKLWLPRVGVYGQATMQNVVPSLPAALTSAMQQMGQELKGLGKLQYRIGADVSQTIWDGGASAARRNLVRSREEMQRTGLDVEMYTLRERVENLYFSILLTEQQIDRNEATRKLILFNLERIRAMLRNGTAMQSDMDMIEAQALTVGQNIMEAQSAMKGYRDVLALFIGEDIGMTQLEWPAPEMPAKGLSNRPELRLFEHRLACNQANLRLQDTSVMPRLGFFMQAYYGYPGIDYFKSMITREPTFNLVGGVKISWNIDSFYTRKNSSRRAQVNAADIVADREIFLFNTGLESASRERAIEGMLDVMRDDERIIALRSNVRRAAESQLENGVIDATALMTKITDENLAMLTAIYHKVQYIQLIYKLKYILNQ